MDFPVFFFLNYLLARGSGVFPVNFLHRSRSSCEDDNERLFVTSERITFCLKNSEKQWQTYYIVSIAHNPSGGSICPQTLFKQQPNRSPPVDISVELRGPSSPNHFQKKNNLSKFTLESFTLQLPPLSTTGCCDGP